jgi:hypothetical protein
MASGKQAGLTIADVREQAAFSKGSEAAIKAILEIYEMALDDRKVLFGSNTLMTIIADYPIEDIFDILSHKEEKFSQCVKTGEIVVTDYGEKLIVTWVNQDRIHFDGIWDSGNLRGRTVSNVTLTDISAHKDSNYRPQDTYNIKLEQAKYEWE